MQQFDGVDPGFELSVLPAENCGLPAGDVEVGDGARGVTEDKLGSLQSRGFR